MSGKIGDYIHLRKKNYMDYGLYHARNDLNEKITDNQHGLPAKFNERIEELKQRIANDSHGYENILEKQWTQFLYEPSSTPNRYLQTRKKVIDLVNKEILKVTKGFNQWALTDDLKVVKNDKWMTETTSLSREDLKAFISKLQKRISNLKDTNKIELHQKKMMYEQIVKELKAKVAQMQRDLQSSILAKDIILQGSQINIPSFVDFCNQSLSIPKGNVLGVVGETLAAYLSAIKTGVVKQTEQEILKRIKGSETSGVKIDTHQIATNLADLDKVYGTKNYKSNDFTMELRSSQGKLDVEIGYVNPGLQNVLASVKYSSQKYADIKKAIIFVNTVL